MRFAALISAAGASTRMGMPKALAPWAPGQDEAARPLLLHQVHVLAEMRAAFGQAETSPRDDLGRGDSEAGRLPRGGSSRSAIEPANPHGAHQDRRGGHALVSVVVVLGHAAHEVRQALAVPPWVTLVDHPEWARGRSSSLEVGASALAGTALDAVLIAAVDQPLFATVLASLCLAWTEADEVLVPVHCGRRGHPILLSGRLLPRLANVSTYPEGLRDLVRGAARRELEVEDARIHLDLNTPEALAAASGSSVRTGLIR